MTPDPDYLQTTIVSIGPAPALRLDRRPGSSFAATGGSNMSTVLGLPVRPMPARRARPRTRVGGVLGAEADIAAGGRHALLARREVAGPRADLVGDDEAPRVVLGAARRCGGRHDAGDHEQSEDDVLIECPRGAPRDGCFSTNEHHGRWLIQPAGGAGACSFGEQGAAAASSPL